VSFAAAVRPWRLSGLEPGQRLVINGSFILKAELGKGAAAHEH